MIGYYVHHHGQGHVTRALGLAAELGTQVTGLSSLPRPDDWVGDWVRLDPDDDGTPVVDPTARGRLHWVPRRHGGLTSRMARIASWVDAARPDLVVCDVSVEVTLLCRLLGVPVVGVVQPGLRDDPAHRLGHGVSDLLVAFVPEGARSAVQGLDQRDAARLHCLGAVQSRSGGAPHVPVEPRTALVLGGRGGGGLSAGAITRAETLTPGWRWSALGGRSERWVADPTEWIARADVVVSHAGLGALADVAVARRPAVVIPAERPHGEQRCTAEVLRDGPWPVVVVDDPERAPWDEVVAAAAALDGQDWRQWHDGRASARFAALVRGLGGAE
ncbi:glycosyltransferase [Nocardioides daphniae]|uniref:Glycosyl transferase family 28 C-terminal domain-containing protein n=1 Tax=Nocardioides daphniae TaxID=402297 RepID=A0A4P7UDW3_9ACTN|nr:glycosyltransferase [Nocardioides daphniae]QCC77538.1 hypothetical protein E2C04_10785 [Nocardioides daphniae]GGD30985.1 hypothetical protein GCM10007231_33130 [Nocardioides daphniae]